MKTAAPIVALLILATMLNPVAASGSLGGSNYYHPYPTGIVPGDIVIGHNPLSSIVIPGYWTHTGIIAYYDYYANDWVVVEAWDDPSAVRLVYLSDFLRRYDTVAVLRVATTDYVRQNAVSFALQQLGKPYDWGWWTKQVYGDSYYCSELVWASYIAAGGPDIDANPGFSWKYLNGVAPQESTTTVTPT
ncbi:YiiX/YebB-like N1pC/P60 family cysteine hydrolase [Thermococcus thioreducens]|uniref:YiiX/YebB-like N1pC/P60 family cysteine hydrolase n=1 Tax=Thermococcus thioreducens TaxID=277988 RepID=UPI000ADE3114|nr:YiiX/YebB-like N1pC/P60 family cysteine hydrolase [Thermococcus thioreducens]